MYGLCYIIYQHNCLSVSLSHGCFCFKRLRVVSFRDNMFERSFMVALILPLFMYSTNFLDSCGLVLVLDWFCWIFESTFWFAFASLNSFNNSLDCYRTILRWNASEWSFTFELRLGFCSMRDGITIIALNVRCFIAESCIHAFNNRVISSL